MDDLILTLSLIQRTALVHYGCVSGFMLLNSSKDTTKFQTIIGVRLLTVTVKWTHIRRLEGRCS